MRVKILYGFRGVETREQSLAAGEHELESGLASVLIGMGQAIALEAPKSETVSEVETPAAVPTVKPKSKR